MTHDLKEIKVMRNKLGFTQNAFAKLAGVSQSLIAKIESGRIDPSYTNAKKIFNAIDTTRTKQEAKAHEIMTRNLISVAPDDTINKAIEKMKKHNVSQLPVIDQNKSIGAVSEANILEALMNHKGNQISDIMTDSPPVISINTTLTAISNLLRFCPMVLVSKDGELRGIITKSDLLGKVFS